MGDLLLDPLNITILGGASGASGTFPGDFDDFDDMMGSDLTVTEAALEGTSADITLQAQNSIKTSGTFDQDSNGEGTILRLQSNVDLILQTRNSAADAASDGIDLTVATVEIQTQGDGKLEFTSGVDGGDGGSAPIKVGDMKTLGSGGGITLNAEGAVTTGALTTAANATGDTAGIQITAGSNININGALKTGQADETTSPVTSGSIVITTTGGTITTAAGAALQTGNAPITGGGNNDNALSGSINLTADGLITLAAAVATGTATIDGGNATATTGSITITSKNGGITGDANATITTGNATATENNDQQDSISGDITLNADGAIGLAANSAGTGDALRTGDATQTNAAGGNDNIFVGDIKIQQGTATSAPNSFTNGSSGAVDVQIGTPTSVGVSFNPGQLSATTDTGDILVTTDQGIRVITLATGGGAQNVSITATGAANLLLETTLTDAVSGDTVTFDAATGTIFQEHTDLMIGPGTLTLRANTIDFKGLTDSIIPGSGTVILEPGEANKSVGVAGATGDLMITTADLLAIKNGFDDIIIGREDATADVTVNTHTFNDSITFRTGDGAGGGTGDVVINGDVITATDESANIKIVAGGKADLNANLTTGTHTVAESGVADAALSGSITVEADLAIEGGSSILTTDTATADGATDNDTATTGSITLKSGSDGAGGDIRFTAANALDIGAATVTNGDAGDTAKTGNITITAADAFTSDGTNAVDVRFGKADGMSGTSTAGQFGATTDDGTNAIINVTTAEALTLGKLDTTDAQADTVTITVTGAGIKLTVAAASDLDIDKITLTADDIDVSVADAFKGSTGTLTLQPNAAARTIGIGGGTGDFNLSDTDIANIDDGFASIIIGKTDSGAVDIDAVTIVDPVSVRGGAMTVDGLDAGGNNVSLESTGTITDAGADNTAVDITGGDLTIVNSTGVGTNAADSLNLSVANLTITTTSGDAFLTEADGIGLGSITLTGTKDLTLDAIKGDITNNTSAIAADDLTLTATESGKAIGATTAANDINVTLTGTLTATASTGAGGIFVTETGDMSVVSVDAGTGNVELESDGTITDTGADNTVVDVTGAALTIRNSTGVGQSAADSLNLSVDNLTITTTSGDVFLTEADGIGLGTITLTGTKEPDAGCDQGRHHEQHVGDSGRRRDADGDGE